MQLRDPADAVAAAIIDRNHGFDGEADDGLDLARELLKAAMRARIVACPMLSERAEGVLNWFN